MAKLTFDRVDYWTEFKLEIIEAYAQEYSRIFNAPNQQFLSHVYIDAFAGSGTNISKTTGEPIEGSPLVALGVTPKFEEYHMIELDASKASELQSTVGMRDDVHLYQGDCNQILINEVFPQVQYKDYRRGLCLLDPYGLHLNWEVMKRAGEMRSIDLFLNFPLMDMNRNVFWRHPEGVSASDIERMNLFWGDDSWRTVVYDTVDTLFGPEDHKRESDVVVKAFAKRLRDKAGFAEVIEPLPMRNKRGAVVYYLFFASQKRSATKIAKHLFESYRGKGASNG